MTPPEQISKYRVERILGTGTFATVYLAYDPDLDSYCAVKVLADQWARDESARTWFLNEARWMFGIDHPRILRVFTSGTTDDGHPYFVMEYADQGNLADYMKTRRERDKGFSLNEALEISLEIAEGLAGAHSHGIVHRDLKPRNILLRSQPVWGFRSSEPDSTDNPPFELKLADFGLARQLEKGTYSLAGAGTPLYMAPEQLKAALEDHPDPRSDIYAAATILYELLAGRPPHPYQSPGQIISAHLTEDPPPIDSLRPGIPEQVAEVIHQGLQKEPEHRYPTALAWRGALKQMRDEFDDDDDSPVISDPVERPAAAARRNEDETIQVDLGEASPLAANARPSRGIGPNYIETTQINNAPTVVATPDQDEHPGRGDRLVNHARQPGSLFPRWTLYLGGLASILGVAGLITVILLSLPDVGGSGSDTELGAIATPTEAASPTETPTPEPTPEPSPTEAEPTAEPTVTPTPEPAGLDPEIERQTRAALEGLPGLSSSMVIFPGGDRIEYSADRRVPSASVIKLWIAGAGYEAIADGDLDPDEVMTVAESDQVPGTGILNRSEYVGREVRLSDLLEIMLLYSDNTAANIVTRMIGGTERVNSYAAEHGYGDTQMQRMLGELDPNRENYTSAADTGQFLERLVNDDVVDPEVSSLVRDILQRRQANETDQVNYFGRELPPAVAYGHVSGLLPNVRNDAGYFLGEDGEPVIVVALLDNLPSEDAGVESIGRTVREVYDALHVEE